MTDKSVIDILSKMNAKSGSDDVLQLYQQIFEHLPVAMYACDVEGRIILYNEAATKLWGRKPDTAKERWGGSLRVFNSKGEIISREDSPIGKVIRDGKASAPVEISLERFDGTRLSVVPHLRPLFDKENKIIGVICVLLDITEQKKNVSENKVLLEKEVYERTSELQKKNEQLHMSEERYHRMVAEVQDYAIIFLSNEGTILNWNKGAERIKGYSADEIIGKNFRIFYTPEAREDKLPDRLLGEAYSNQRAYHEGWRVRKDGTKFWGSVTITAIHDDQENVVGFTKVTRDLTDKKLAEDELRQKSEELMTKNNELAQMNQELASFAYVSSHDLQEPLRKIQTFATRIVETEEQNLSPKAKDYFGRMQNAALRMQTLIEDLLSYSRTNTEEKVFEVADLNSILDEVTTTELKETIDEKSAKIESEKLPTLSVIKFQFRQLLVNIIGNALKFSKADVPPVISITTEIVSGSKIDYRTADHSKKYHHISIRDNGIGFEPEHRFKIFEVFQRLHGRMEYSGTGIGLAICKKIMDNHSGIILADSAPDKGATFHLYLPVAK